MEAVGTGCEHCVKVCGPVCLRENALKHQEAGSECVMECAGCQTIVLQWSQGERGQAESCWGRKDESVKGWGSQGGQSPSQGEAEIPLLGSGGVGWGRPGCPRRLVY